jgi:uncharacterized protein with GYD domain
MPKYLVQASYTPEGLQGVRKEGGTARRTATRTLIEGLGGQMESFYFAFGTDDVIIVADLPDNRTAAAVGLAVNAEGHIRSRTTVLITPEELDEAAKTSVNFHAPGT